MPHVLELITRGDLGGAQRNTLAQMMGLKSKFDFSLAIGENGYMAQAAVREGIRTFILRNLIRPISPVRDCLGVQEIVRLIRRIKPDLIHCHSSKAGILGRMAARLRGVPVLFTAHGWALADGVSPWKRVFYAGIERMAARWSGAIITVSESDMRLARRFGVGRPEQLRCIPNGVAPTLLLARPETEGLVRVLMVARFAPPKEQALLLRAMFRVRRPMEVVFVGDGPELEAVRRSAAQCPERHLVTFLGAREDVEEILSTVQVFALLSRWEGLPISILEAMRAGLPVVASAVGGVSELVHDGRTGFLIPPGDEALLADRLELLAGDPGLRARLGTASRVHCLDKYSLDNRLVQLGKLYDALIGEKKALSVIH
jgi:glycosyltransferase involved in cell wall biosynthesis